MNEVSLTEALRLLSKKIDHSVLHPAAFEDDFFKGADTAVACNTAAFCIPSFMVDKIARRLAGTTVHTCAVVGFPHGNAHTAVKVHEAVQAVDNGASEIDMVVNLSFVQSGDWQAVEREIADIHTVVTERRAILKVIFETCYLSDDAIVRLCAVASKIAVAFVKTSTGFGPAGATVHHVSLMRNSLPDAINIKASGGIRTLADMRRFLEVGAARIGTSSTAAILEDASKGFCAVSFN